MKSIILIIAAFGLILLFSPPVEAEWKVDVSGKHIQASISGSVVYGDKQRFVFSKGNCDAVQHLFSTYTTKQGNFEKLKGKVLVIDFNGERIGAKLIASRKAMAGHLLMFSLGTYDKGFIEKLIRTNTRIDITIVDGNGHKASDYFDILSNNWSTAEALEAIEAAYNDCIQ